MREPSQKQGLSTKSIHAGEPGPIYGRAITLPIFQSSTFEYAGEAGYDDIRYIRLNNTPNHQALHEKLCALEGAEAAVVTASGMAAISTALLALVGRDEHLISQNSLYGGTHHFLKHYFSELGRKVDFVSFEDLENIEKFVRPETRAIYVESISNPMLRIPDHARVIAQAKKQKLLTLIDNTFPSPINFNPIALGYDVVLHSATKYLNGHTDIVAGAVLGQKDPLTRVTRLLNHLGGALDPHACFLLSRGIKTLAVRVRAQNESALEFARALEKHPKIERLFYPGLESHPDYLRAKQYFRGFGGVVSFEYGGTVEQLDRALRSLKLAYLAPSLGGIETLVTRPVTTSHSGVSKVDLTQLGIKETLVRVSIGLEDPADLINDFSKAL